MRTHAGTIPTALVALLLAGLPQVARAQDDVPGDVPGDASGPERAEQHRAERAEDALDAARGLFRPRSSGNQARSRSTTADPDAHASLVLRDLAVHVEDLDGQDRVLARRILARPTDDLQESWPGVKYDGAPTADTCTLPDGDEQPAETEQPGGPGQEVCIHWVTDTDHRDSPPATDDDGDGVPDWVQTNQQVLGQVWQRIVVELGYRAPMSDAAAREPGPDGRTDIYLAELRETYGLYGYCAPEWDGEGTRASAYCVLDNDFANYSGDALSDLKVTAAHEFFHAVQVGYRLSVEHWLSEGTAAWVEDEVFDDVDDNLQYLTHSPLAYPGKPLDFTSVSHFNWLYGSWIFWRFLTEYFGEPGETDPAVVREVWERLGSGQAPLPAVRTVLARRDAAFGPVFAAFGALNRVAPRWYDEGRRYAPFVAPVRRKDRYRLVRTRRSTGWEQQTVARLSSRHVAVRPGRGLEGRWKLRLVLDLPPRARGSQANVMVHRRDGAIRWFTFGLNRRGNGRAVLPFNRRNVRFLALTLTNSSAEDHRLPFTFRATAVR